MSTRSLRSAGAPEKSSENVPRRRRGASASRSGAASPSPARQAKNSTRSTAATVEPIPTDTDLWAGSVGSALERQLRLVWGPLALLVVTPLFVNAAALAAKNHDSSFAIMLSAYSSWGELLRAAFPAPTSTALAAVAVFCAFQLLLFLALPGKAFPGAVAPSGFVPTYRRSGPAAFVLTAVGFLGGSTLGAGWFEPTVVYDELLPIMTLLNVSVTCAAAPHHDAPQRLGLHRAAFGLSCLAPSTDFTALNFFMVHGRADTRT